MDFLICYEHIEREVENACLLMMELEKRGYDVKIVSESLLWIRNTIFNYVTKPKILIVPYLFQDQNVNLFLDKFTNHELIIVNLRYEQVLNRKMLGTGFHDPKGMAKNAYHVCWSELNKQRLLDAGINEENLLLVGSISTDFDRKEFSNYYLSKTELSKEFSLNPDKEWVLFISNFTLVNWSPGMIKDFQNMISTNVSDLQESMIESKAHLVQWINNFLLDYPEYEFIYRPHPSELEDPYLVELAKSFDNFHIISKQSVKQWIKICEHLNTWRSTSIADAYFMNKYCSILRPIPISKELDSELMVEADYVCTYEDFVKVNTSSNHPFPIKDEEISKYYIFESQPVYKKLCDELERIIHDPLKIQKYCINRRKNTFLSICKRHIEIIVIIFSHYLKINRFIPINNYRLYAIQKQHYGLLKTIRSCRKNLRDKVGI